MACRVERRELTAQPDGVGNQRLDDPDIGGRRELTLEAAPLLGDERRMTTRALTQRLGSHEPVGQAVVTERRERALGIEHGFVELAQLTAQLAVARVELGALVVQSLEARLESGDLVAGQVQPNRTQLLDDAAVLLRRLRLALERRELAAHLAQQVVEPHEVRLGRDEDAARRAPCAAGTSGRRRLLR